jgi:hypothetical protein
MTPEQTEAALEELHDAVVKIDLTLNDGLKAMVAEHRLELKAINVAVQTMRDQITATFEIFKRVMNTGVTITGALIALLLSIIGYLLVNPVGLH